MPPIKASRASARPSKMVGAVPSKAAQTIGADSPGSIHGSKTMTSAKQEKDYKDHKMQAKTQLADRENYLASRNPTYILNYLMRKTQFDSHQVKALQTIYRKFKGNYNMDRLRFREMVASLFGITDSIMLDRIFQAFDGDNQGSVSETEWIIGLSIQLRGTLDQQIAYAYDVYDINGDRALGREEIHNCLRGCLHTIPGVLEPEEMDEALNEVVELCLKKFDINHDNNIKFPEFRHVLRHDPLLLEAFGTCLPTEKSVMPFMALLDQNPRSYNYYLSRPKDHAWLKERDRYHRYKPHNSNYNESFDDDDDPSGNSISPVLWSMSTLDDHNLNHDEKKAKVKVKEEKIDKSAKIPDSKKKKAKG